MNKENVKLTNQEAREIIGKITLNRLSEKEVEALDVAIELLEKADDSSMPYDKGALTAVRGCILPLKIMREGLADDKESSKQTLDAAIYNLQTYLLELEEKQIECYNED